MGYCVQADIEKEFPALSFSGTTKVTTTALGDWIDQESAYIDSRIAVRYITPVTAGAEAMKVLKRICIFRVSERVKNAIEVKSNVSQADSEQKYTQNYVRTPNQDLKDIAEGKMILIGATLVNQGGSVSSFEAGTDEENCHTFKTDEQQW